MCSVKCLITSALMLVAAVAAAQGAEFFDGFEGYAAGGYPGDGWQMLYNAQNDPGHNKVVNTVAYSGDKSLQIYGSHDYGSRWAAVATVALPAWNEPFCLSVALRPGDDAEPGGHYSDAQIALTYPISTGLALIRFRGEQTISLYWEDTVAEEGVTYTPLQWYHCQLSVLPASRRIFCSMDGRYLGCTSVPSSRWPSSNFYLDFGSGDGIAWLDDAWAGPVGAAGPYLEPMSFLTDAIEDYLPTHTGPVGVPVPFAIIPQYVSDLYSGASVPIPSALNEQCDNLADDKKWIGALCDVELTVTDPLGRTVDKDGGTLPGASYLCNDLDGDGDNEVTILLDTASFVVGDYTVDVSNPQSDCETFSLFCYDPDLELLIPIAVGEELAGGGRGQYDFTAIPEPATVGLVVLGAGALGLLRRRRERRTR